MNITQTVDIPASHKLTIDVPREVPEGPVILTFNPAKAEKAADPNRKSVSRFLVYFPRQHTAMALLTNGNSGMNGMIENCFVLDTNAVIFLTTRGNVIPSDLENELDKANLYISVISEIELFSKPALPPDEEESLRFFYRTGSILLIFQAMLKKRLLRFAVLPNLNCRTVLLPPPPLF